MSWWKYSLCMMAGGLVWLCALPTAQATTATNTTPATATPLSPGVLIVHDALDGSEGRPNTILGQFLDPFHQAVLLTDVNSSVLGNGHASELNGVPLRFNGSAYFRVSGAPDFNFTGAQSQSGMYSYQFDIFDAQHHLIESTPPQYEDVSPGLIDNIWLDPSSDPRRVGGTVNVTLNNIAGPGTGDSRDFFVFAGLHPFQAFTAKIENPMIPAMIGAFSSSYTLLSKSDPTDPTATLTGHADALGRILIGVTGAPDTGFIGQHAEVGTYTLEVIPIGVPEPSTLALAACCAILIGSFRARRRLARNQMPRQRSTDHRPSPPAR